MPDPTDSFIVKKSLKGVKNIKGKAVDCRLPITGDILAKFVQPLPPVIGNSFHQSMLKAMFLLVFYAF